MDSEHGLDMALVFDTGPLDELFEILGDEGMTVVEEILADFLVEAPRLVARIEDGATKGNLVTIRDASHTLKVASANVGAIALSQHCDLTERAARAHHDTTATDRSREVRPLFDETIARIRAWRS